MAWLAGAIGSLSLSAQAAAFGCPDCNVSIFLPQMSGADAVGDDDEASRKRKSKNLYVAKIMILNLVIREAPQPPFPPLSSNLPLLHGSRWGDRKSVV